MSMLISAFMFIALLAIAFAHFLWSFGNTWPIRGEKLLAQTVIGTAGIDRMPPRLKTFAIAAFLLAAGIAGLALADHEGGGPLLTVIGFALAAVFLVRGVLAYTPGWTAKTPEPNFRLNDRRVYGPLCILLGIGFVALAVMRLV